MWVMIDTETENEITDLYTHLSKEGSNQNGITKHILEFKICRRNRQIRINLGAKLTKMTYAKAYVIFCIILYCFFSKSLFFLTRFIKQKKLG